MSSDMVERCVQAFIAKACELDLSNDSAEGFAAMPDEARATFRACIAAAIDAAQQESSHVR